MPIESLENELSPGVGLEPTSPRGHQLARQVKFDLEADPF
jgi:hypothetical protein